MRQDMPPEGRSHHTLQTCQRYWTWDHSDLWIHMTAERNKGNKATLRHPRRGNSKPQTLKNAADVGRTLAGGSSRETFLGDLPFQHFSVYRSSPSSKCPSANWGLQGKECHLIMKTHSCFFPQTKHFLNNKGVFESHGSVLKMPYSFYQIDPELI